VIALVDYGAGNLTSVRKALAAIGSDAWTPSVAGELGRARGIIVPGVGHFDATRALTEDHPRDSRRRRAAPGNLCRHAVAVRGQL
jgi:glutamine amidotransferase